jgi:hypothetical protein
MNEISNKCLYIKIIKKNYSAKYFVIGLTNNFRNICFVLIQSILIAMLSFVKNQVSVPSKDI